MNARFARRLRNGSIVLAIVLAIGHFDRRLDDSLRSSTFLTGWFLFASMLVLAAYQVRKKVSFLPLIDTKGWLQFHLYLGLSTSVVFLLHAGWQWPHSVFGYLLFSCYVSLFLSGVLGLVMSRVVPGRLTSRGQEVIFEQIPLHRRQIFKQVEGLVIHNSAGLTNSPVAQLYLDELVPFFSRPRGWLSHLVHSDRHRVDMLRKLDDAKVFLNREEEKSADEIIECIRIKDDLDYQFVWQGILKLWLFVHVPLTYVMLVLMAVHAIVACAFASSHL